MDFKITQRLRFNMYCNNEILYRCLVNCDDLGIPFLCNAEACDKCVLWDCFYCEEHLRSICGVYLAPSTTGHGKGLFSAKQFKRGQKIAHYGGEIISPEEMHSRYGWMTNECGDYFVVTAPYGIEIENSENVRDACRIRGAASYCNSIHGTGMKSNAQLGSRYVRATRTIEPDHEILVAYGRDYWKTTNCQHETKVFSDLVEGQPIKLRLFI